MDRYTVTATNEFDQRMAEIEQDPLGFGMAQTVKYLAEIWERCEHLESLPYRFGKETINGFSYFTFTHKAHRIFYAIEEKHKTVVLVTILHGAMKPELHLGSNSEPTN